MKKTINGFFDKPISGFLRRLGLHQHADTAASEAFVWGFLTKKNPNFDNLLPINDPFLSTTKKENFFSPLEPLESSAITSQASDEILVNIPSQPPLKGSPGGPMNEKEADGTDELIVHLPFCNPLSNRTKEGFLLHSPLFRIESNAMKLARILSLVLFLCGFFVWCFVHPGLSSKNDASSIVTQTSFPTPIQLLLADPESEFGMEREALDPQKQTREYEANTL